MCRGVGCVRGLGRECVEGNGVGVCRGEGHGSVGGEEQGQGVLEGVSVFWISNKNAGSFKWLWI